jgi:hypothetical protein
MTDDDDELVYRALFGDGPPDPDPSLPCYPPPERRRYGELRQLSATTAEVVLLVEDDDGLPIRTELHPLVWGRAGGWEPPEWTEATP